MLIATINIDKSKKLWIVVMAAVCIAILLICISFVCIYSKENKNININKSKNRIFNLNAYYAEYSLTIFSNKNQNTYTIKEYFLNKDEKENFKIDFENELGEHITYIIRDNSLNISSDKQLSSFNILDYNVSKTNLLSISTFFELYNKVLANINNNFARIETKNIDNNIHYIIYFDKIKEDEINEEFNQYKKLISDGFYISKLELILNNENIPIEYYAFDENDKVYLAIKYTNFNILDKFNEKIFANFNK